MKREKKRPSEKSTVQSLRKTTRKADDVGALRESEAKYRGFIENLSVMFYAAEPFPPYSPTYISPAFAQFGYPLEEWSESADFWTRVLHPEDRDWVLEKTEAAMRAGAETDYEYRIVARNGATCWVRDRGSFIRDEQGNSIAWQGIILDITERKLDEQRLQRSEKLYRTLAHSIPQTGVVLFDRDYRYTLADGSLLEKHGFSRQMFEGKTLWEVFSPEICEEWSDYYRRALGGETVSLEQEGEEGWFQIYVVPVKNERGEIFAGMVMWQDVTKQKASENALRESEQRYRALSEKSLGLICAHDLAGNLLSVNPAAAKSFGYDSAEELVGKPLQSLVPPDAVPLFDAYLERIKATGEFFGLFRVLTKNGEEKILRVSNTLYQESGKPAFVLGNAQDITSLKRTEQELRALFEAMTDVIIVLDKNGRYLKIAPTNPSLLYRPAEELVGKTLADTFPAEQARMFLDVVRNALETKQTQTLEYTLPIAGREVWFAATVAPMIADTVILVARDITERKHAEAALIESEARYRSLGEGIMHQVWTAQPDGKLDYVNGRALDYFGRTAEEILGESWQTVVHREDLPESVKRWTHSLESGIDYDMEFRLRRHDGEYCWHKARATAGLDADGNIVNWYGTNTDINDKKIAEAKLNHNALHDALTNLPNRIKFMNQLERAVSRAERSSEFKFAVLFLDLDRFKIINDSLGHSIGDKLLVAIAERLESCVRPSDIVARLGGDEFTVLLNNINEPADAVRVASRLLEKISAPFRLDSYEVVTSASIGIIISDEVRRLPEDFLRDADTAMYRAKAAGKSRYEIFDREMHIRNMNLLQLENDLRRAIEREEFRVFYQPIITLETGEIREFEALIRWQHPQHGLVSPNEFITMAEETGLIIPIGIWILEEAARQTAEWQKRFLFHKNLSISVNLSAKQLMHPNLTAQVAAVLEKTALDSRCLKLEVTESMVMENSDQALTVISELNRLGIALSTDDFGTGYSSLSYLHRFPFSRLKIDRSFVSKMDSDQKSEAIVRTILLLAQNLNIEVVAEGIETTPQLNSLRQLGCRTGQGYLFSKPVTAEAAARLLQNGLQSDTSAPFYGFGETEIHQLLELDKVQ